MPVVSSDRTNLWNTRRKLMGNLIPALIGVPIGVIGVLQILKTLQFHGKGLYLVIVAIVLMWILVNVVSSIENPKLKRELKRRMQAKQTDLASDAVFVGFARPTYSSWLDPHEDIGFLSFDGDSVRFDGEQIQVQVPRNQIEVIRYRANPHSLALVGRWVSIEGKNDDKPIRLMIEPRECRTLIGNRFFSTRLRKQLEAWLKKGKAQT